MSENVPPWHQKEKDLIVSTVPTAKPVTAVAESPVKFFVLQVAEAGPPTLSKPLNSLQQVAGIVSETPSTSWVLAFKGEIVKLNATDALVSMSDGANKAGVELPPGVLNKLLEDYLPKFIGLTQPELEEHSVG